MSSATSLLQNQVVVNPDRFALRFKPAAYLSIRRQRLNERGRSLMCEDCVCGRHRACSGSVCGCVHHEFNVIAGLVRVATEQLGEDTRQY